jgi:hypothetical protein
MLGMGPVGRAVGTGIEVAVGAEVMIWAGVVEVGLRFAAGVGVAVAVGLAGMIVPTGSFESGVAVGTGIDAGGDWVVSPVGVADCG